MPIYALADITPKTQGPGTFWVAPDAHVIGNVVLGQDVGIWFGSVLRGDNEPIVVGDRSNIQELCMVRRTKPNGNRAFFLRRFARCPYRRSNFFGDRSMPTTGLSRSRL